jgi:hypothetical protein
MTQLSRGLRTSLIGLLAGVGAAICSAAYADSGSIQISIFKAGWFVGGSGGSGVLTFHGKRYPLAIGGLSAGLVFGASHTRLSGTVTNIRSPSDVAGVYGGAGAGAAIGGGVRAILLHNNKGAQMHLQGGQVGLMVNADFSGMSVSLK